MTSLLESFNVLHSYPPHYLSTATFNAPTVAYSKRVHGKFLECFNITQETKAQDESKYVADSLKPIFDRLTKIRKLEGLALTHGGEIDKMRVDGKFMDLEKNVLQGQYVLLYMLRRCYDILCRLLLSGEPVSEELTSIANKLLAVRKCLNEVPKYGGSFSARDLYLLKEQLNEQEDDDDDYDGDTELLNEEGEGGEECGEPVSL
ncbi:hypothetical protein BDM02DRAFT_3193030 [Thelephora ganbajun]|uniref:Uncharacterized protein n=1 Tax=Thelephora ganbajun TaxID=370292 RepID=A0ACB6YZ16_THEGA|nr:hypothetical protein BDM02DRAFT_3193030 [Thelephora ganbajun]